MWTLMTLRNTDEVKVNLHLIGFLRVYIMVYWLSEYFTECHNNCLVFGFPNVINTQLSVCWQWGVSTNEKNATFSICRVLYEHFNNYHLNKGVHLFYFIIIQSTLSIISKVLTYEFKTVCRLNISQCSQGRTM